MLPTLLGLGDAGLDAEVDGFLLRAGPGPSSTLVADFLRLYSGERRNEAARALIAKGVGAPAVSSALSELAMLGKFNSSTAWGLLSLASGAASGFHGYRRNNSIGWAVAWFALGTVLPVITPVIALAQGFGKRKA